MKLMRKTAYRTLGILTLPVVVVFGALGILFQGLAWVCMEIVAVCPGATLQRNPLGKFW